MAVVTIILPATKRTASQTALRFRDTVDGILKAITNCQVE